MIKDYVEAVIKSIKKKRNKRDRKKRIRENIGLIRGDKYGFRDSVTVVSWYDSSSNTISAICYKDKCCSIYTIYGLEFIRVYYRFF